MALSKKVFFGSLFEFNTAGAEDLITEFRNTFSEPSSAPFISYDKFNKVFSCEVDHGEIRQIPAFIANFQAYVERHSKRRDDFVESPRLRPIRGTCLNDEQEDEFVHKQDLRAATTRILDFDEESDTQDEEGSTSSGNHVTYWTPVDGDIEILTNDIAEKVATLTGCILWPKPAERRVRLENGDTELARTKLINLEPYMTLAAKHRTKAESRANSNVLIAHAGGRETALRFVRPSLPHPGFARTIVAPTAQTLLDNTALCELRIRDGAEYVKPPNLDLLGDELPSQNNIGPSKIFDLIAIPSLGSSVNIEPRTSPEKGTFTNVSEDQPTTKFLGTTGALRVTEWSRNVEPDATADVEPPEPLPEQFPVRRRVLAEDSSDEDDDVTPDPTPQNTLPNRRNDTDFEGYNTSELSGQLAPAVEMNNAYSQDSSERIQRSQSSTSTTKQEKPHARTSNPKVPSRNMFDILTGSSDIQDLADNSENSRSLSPPISTFGSNLIDLAAEVNPCLAPNNDIGMSGAFTVVGQKSKKQSPPKNVAFKDNVSRLGRGVRGDEGPQTPDRRDAKTLQSRIYPSHEHSGAYHAQYDPPTPPLPHPVSKDMLPPPAPQQISGKHTRVDDRISRHRGAERSASSEKALIDISETPAAETLTLPPPGFDYHINTRFGPIGDCLIDTPVEEGFHRQSILPSPNGSSERTWSSSAISAAPRGFIDYTPQFTIPKRNMKYLQQEAATQLKAQMEARSQDKGSNDSAPVHTLPPERLQAPDESQSRTFHNVMHQQSGNPGKVKGKGTGGKAGNKQETKKDRDLRIAKAKAEAYGSTTASISAQPSPKPSSVPEKMSAKKRELIRKNPDMAALHPEHVEKVSLEAQTVSLRAKLEPLFDAARAFSGYLQFEYQIGQALVFGNGRLKDGNLYTEKEWTELLDSDNSAGAAVAFNHIVTTNGLEVDQLLALKDSDGISRVWQSHQPLTSSVTFEFCCQDKTGQEFVIEVGNNGQYSLMKSRSFIGKVALHFPGQIWDACATLSGTSEWSDVSLELAQGVAQFVAFLYVPRDSSKVSIYYRMPGNNTFDIRDVTVRRVSIHDCLLADREQFQLKIIEVKDLTHSTHPSDKKLFRSYEFGFNDMVEKGRIHYEVSIVHSDISNIFNANKELEVGDLTDKANGRALVTHLFVRKSLSLLTYLIERIDWLGATNVGTLRRVQEESYRKQAFINASLPPQALTHIGRAMPVRIGNLVTPGTQQSTLRATIPGTANLHNPSVIVDTNESRVIPGVRAGTNADLYQQDGQYFYYGQGGARIPVVASDIVGLQNMALNVTNDPIMPHESASQIGEIARLRQAAESLSAAGQARRRLPGDNKPEGFW